MNIFAKKSIWNKIFIVLGIILLCSFIIPKPVHAAGLTSFVGELLEPVMDLLVTIGDGIMQVIHSILMGQEVSLLRIDTNADWFTVVRWAVAIIAGIAVAALLIATGAGIAALLAGAAKAIGAVAAGVAIGSIIGFALEGGIYVGTRVFTLEAFDNLAVLPIYTVTPEEIFKGRITLFDVNFFEPVTTMDQNSETRLTYVLNLEKADGSGESYSINRATIDEVGVELLSKGINITIQEITQEQYRDPLVTETDAFKGTINDWNFSFRVYSVSQKYTPPYVEQLRSTIASWYVTLRTMALVGMMSVLVYIGIRMLLSSTSSQQKAKYKGMIFDWLVGMCLLFVMHYGMVFVNIFADQLIDILASNDKSIKADMVQLDEGGKIEEALNEAGYTIVDEADLDSKATDGSIIAKSHFAENGDMQEGDYIQWVTNLSGSLRMLANTNRNESEAYVGYTILFLVMVFYTAFFAYTYIKRVIYMAFLTLIAPIVALTYPIDKANDGQAQGFNIWVKEYIFNLLLQPLHLLLYTILISSAAELATNNMLYAMIAIGFMVPAEKFLRSIFNFQKASTPGVLGAGAGAALTMSGLRWLMGHGPKGGHRTNNNTSSGGDNATDENTQITTGENKVKMADVFGSTTPKTDDATSRNDKIDQKFSEETSGGETSSNETYKVNIPYKDNIDLYEMKGDFSDSVELNDKLIEAQKSPELPTSSESTDSSETSDTSEIPKVPTTPTTPNVPQSSSITPNSEKKKPILKRAKRAIKNLPRTVGNSSKAYISGIGRSAAKSLANSNPIGRAGRIFTGALTGAALGTIGLATGIASGSAGDALRNAGVGLAGGYKLGADASGALGERLDVDKDQFDRDRLGREEYNKRIVERNRNAKIKDERTLRRIEDKLKVDRKEAERIAQTLGAKAMDNKIDNVDDWIRIEKMVRNRKKENGQSYNYDEAIMAHNFSKQYFSNYSQTTQKKREEMRETWKSNEFKDYQNADEVSRIALRMVDDYNTDD